MMAKTQVVPCGEGCPITVLVVVGSLIMIESKHHGQRHTTYLSLAELSALLDKPDAAIVR